MKKKNLNRNIVFNSCPFHFVSNTFRFTKCKILKLHDKHSVKQQPMHYENKNKKKKYKTSEEGNGKG